MAYGARFPWLTGNPDVATHACPDAANPVVFEIRRGRPRLRAYPKTCRTACSVRPGGWKARRPDSLFSPSGRLESPPHGGFRL